MSTSAKERSCVVCGESLVLYFTCNEPRQPDEFFSVKLEATVQDISPDMRVVNMIVHKRCVQTMDGAKKAGEAVAAFLLVGTVVKVQAGWEGNR